MKTNLLKEAIADAEVIKQLAIDNAKASLNETFDSKIKSMLAAKLQEEAEQDEYDEASQELDEDEEQHEAKERSGEEGEGEEGGEGEEAGEGQDESFDIDAILAEMEEEDKGEDKKKYMSEKKRGGEEKGKEEDMPMPEKDMPEEGEEEEGGGEDNMEETIDLDALIAEMTKEEESQETDEAYGKEEETDEAYGEEKEKDVLDEEEEKRFYKAFKHAYDKMKPQQPKEEPKKESIELQEIKRQAAQLAQKVNETNLINAKLLYLNKVLRNHNLSEQQKLKVVAAFDKAGSVKEAKIVYESINEALNIKVQTTKTALKESLGFASKASGTSTKREIITEADAHVARWQKLAGIRK